MNTPGFNCRNERSQPAQESVKVLHSRRNELKRRIQEKHTQKRGEIRRDILEATRNSRGRVGEGDEELVDGGVTTAVFTPERSMRPTLDGVYGNSQQMHVPAAAGIIPFEGGEWSEFGNQFRVDVSEPAVMEYLLQLEEEIRQEQLVAMYEQAHNQTEASDLEEHFQYLMS